jgi:hypothetical protein
LREQVRKGEAPPEQKQAIFSGSALLEPDVRVELLAVLGHDAEAAVREQARQAFLAEPLDRVLASLARADADPRLFGFSAGHIGDKPGVADAFAKNSACPVHELTRVAVHLTSSGVQALLDDLERFTSDPDLIIAVAQCKGANAEQEELLSEMQKGAIALNELENAAAEAEPDPIKRETLMQQVGRMNVVQRLTLALKGGKTERQLLIRDPNKLVQRSVLQSPRLTPSEVEGFSAMTNLSTEVLRGISMTRAFMKNYVVVKNLVSNPKTPLDVSLHLFPRLTSTDLLKLTANKNIPETLRSSAVKLHRKRKLGQ